MPPYKRYRPLFSRLMVWRERFTGGATTGAQLPLEPSSVGVGSKRIVSVRVASVRGVVLEEYSPPVTSTWFVASLTAEWKARGVATAILAIAGTSERNCPVNGSNISAVSV